MPGDVASLLRDPIPRRVHVVGVGGAGMSAIALVLAQMGHVVSGSDLRMSPVLERLSSSGIHVFVGHEADHVGSAQIVTASPAVAQSNVELVAARRRGLDVVTRSDMLSAIVQLRRTVAVAGTHGKTTTSSMLSLILVAAKTDPSFLIGADVTGVGANARWGEGPLLAIEADESYGAFSSLSPAITVLTNIEADHLDHYGTLDELEAAFEELLLRSSETTAVMIDDPGAARVGSRVGSVGVGLAPHADVQITNVITQRASSTFTLHLDPSTQVTATVGAPGLHNVRNAAMAAVGATLCGVAPDAVVDGLARFAGVPRRFEFRGEANGVFFVDDYAHLPSEVVATLEAARSGGFRRIIAVFQPHRYTRTAAVAGSFSSAFGLADEVVITGIYSAGEDPIPGVSGLLVADAVRAGHDPSHVTYVEERLDVGDAVAALLEPGDLCLTMGAGDLTTLPDELMDRRW